MATPTSTYNAQNGVKATGSYDPLVVKWIIKAARATGADPVALLSTALQESGAQRGRVGDKGTSYGPFQFHEGGALGSHDAAWANTYAPVLNRAELFAKGGVHHGKGAAAVQRPLDQTLYAAGVDSQSPRAKAILKAMGLDVPGADLKLPSGADAQTSVASTPPVTSSKPTLGQTGALGPANSSLSVQGLLDSAKQHLGVPTPRGGEAAAPQTGGQSLIQMLSQPAQPQQLAPLALPSGAKAQTPPNPTMMDKTNSTIVNAATKFLGTPYLWGGTSAKGLDCSGLVQLAVKNATGVTIPRVASAQYAASTKVAPADMQPGDIVAFGTAKNIHHIAIYMGNGKIVEAPHTGTKVRISSLAGRNDIVGAGRFPTS